jgi:hypothetical protein
VIEADTDSPNPFLVTEYAEGPSLSEHVSAAGPLAPVCRLWKYSAKNEAAMPTQ